MTFLEYVRDIAPLECGVHQSFGRVAELVVEAEKADDEAFTAGMFATTRDRAELGAPYPDPKGKREAVLDVIELAICSHRQADHGEDHQARIDALLERSMDEETKTMATRDWWVE
jgi:hypothetical protein